MSTISYGEAPVSHTHQLEVYRQMLRLAWRNVLRNWRHSLATLLAIASGFMAVSLFDGFLTDIEDMYFDSYTHRAMMGNLIIQRKDTAIYGMEDPWKYSLGPKEQKFLEDFFANDPDFKQRVRFLNISGMITSGPNSTIFIASGHDIVEGAEVRGKGWEWNTLAGKPLVLNDKGGVLVGASMGTLIDCEAHDKEMDFILPRGNYTPEDRPFTCKSPRAVLSATTETAQVNAIDLPITGIFDGGFRELDKRSIQISLADAQRLLDTDKISSVTVELKDGRDAQAFIDRLAQAAGKAGIELDIMPWMDHPIAAFMKGGFQILQVFRNLFMSIVVAIGVMSVANTMMKSINERVREIGTLRSLGFIRRHLIFMFSCEGFFLSIIACAGGLVGTILASKFVTGLGIKYKGGVLSVPVMLKIAYAPRAWLLSTLVLSLLAMGTAWFCSRKAARMVVADALRHV